MALEVARRLINGVWRTGTAEDAGGGSQPVGGLVSKEFLFTEGAAPGVYEAELAMVEGDAVFDVVVYSLAAPWVLDNSIDDSEAILEVVDSEGAYIYQAPLTTPPLGVTFDPYPFDAGDKGTSNLNNPLTGWLMASSWPSSVGGGGDYPFITYGYVTMPDDTEAPIPGPMRRYLAADTITARITTTLAGSSPNGVLVVKILYFAAQTPDAPVFTAAP